MEHRRHGHSSFVEEIHAHWQATAEQFFLSKFNMHKYVHFAITKGRNIFFNLIIFQFVGCFLSFVLSLRITLSWSPSFVISLFPFAYLSQLTESSDNQPESLFLPSKTGFFFFFFFANQQKFKEETFFP